LDFTSFENKEGVGSLYDRHRERVRSVDKLIGKWDGTGQGQVKGRGKNMGSFDKVPLTGGKSYYNKQEGDWWQQANLPERLDDDSLLYARFAYTPDPSHRCSNPNPNRPVAFDELMAADIVPELMYI
jgi:hypothetical protein